MTDVNGTTHRFEDAREHTAFWMRLAVRFPQAPLSERFPG
jgi:hypothetical protein